MSFITEKREISVQESICSVISNQQQSVQILKPILLFLVALK